MGDKRRFDLMAKLIAEHIPTTASIVDVAGGKGYLKAALYEHGYKNVTTIDKRNKNSKGRNGYKWGYFHFESSDHYDAVVAMHPDEGTDHAILYAGRNNVPCIVCPCCVKPSAVFYRGSHKYTDWVTHLKKLGTDNGLVVEERNLRMTGKRLVLIFKPKKRSGR